MITSGKYIDRNILLLTITLEGFLFYHFYQREISWRPAANFDQTAYLIDAYRLQQNIHANGLGALWRALWSSQHYNGWALPIEGALSGLIFGGTRWPQLLVLFVGFCALQAVAFATARTAWENRAAGYAILGLILSQRSLWFPEGGLFDFRMDFLAYSLYGVWTCAAIRSKLFLDRPWAIGCGLLAAVLVLNRFISVVYLVVVSVAFAGACVGIWLRKGDDDDLGRRMRQRLINLGLSLSVLTVVAGPILLINRQAIYNYYVVAHLNYEKDIRAREFGIVGLSGHLLYYPESVIVEHLGPAFCWGSAIAIGCSLAARRFTRLNRLPPESQSFRDETPLLQIAFLASAILSPVAVLTADVSKSPVVGSIVGVPAALLIVALAAAVQPKPGENQRWPVSKLVPAGSLVIFALGLFSLFYHAGRHFSEYAQRQDLERLVELDKWLVNYAHEKGWPNPRISFDLIHGSLNAGAITTTGFEQEHQLVEFQTMLGGGIMGVERAEALSLLENSDFVILTDIHKASVYPFYEQLTKYSKDLKEWADRHMTLTRTVPLENFTATIYVRPIVTDSGRPGAGLNGAN